MLSTGGLEQLRVAGRVAGCVFGDSGLESFVPDVHMSPYIEGIHNPELKIPGTISNGI